MVYHKHMEINEIPDEVIDCLFDAIEKDNKLYVILKDDTEQNEGKVEIERDIIRLNWFKKYYGLEKKVLDIGYGI